MGTTTALSPLVVKDIFLPEQSADLPYVNEDYRACPNCGHFNHEDHWTTVGYYEIESLIHHLGYLDHDAIRLGQELDRHGALYKLLRDKVAEVSQWQCDNCEWRGTEGELTTLTRYDCSNDGENYETSHEALLCCSGDCYDDTCTHRDGITKMEGEDGFHPLREDRMGRSFFFKCSCNRTENYCGAYVCVICHQSVFNEVEVAAHICPGLQSPTQVHVNPEAPVVRDLAPQCFCEAGFCCQVHDRHRSGHMLCWRA